MSSRPESFSALIDLSVLRRGVLTGETWIERAVRWAGQDLTIHIAGWKPKPHVDGAWLQEQTSCLPTIARLATQGSILLYTYSELQFEEWRGQPKMMGTFGDLFWRKASKKCPAAVNRPRFRKSIDFHYYLEKDELIGFCSFLLMLEPSVLQGAAAFWNTLPPFDQENLLQLGQFKSLCRGLSKNHYRTPSTSGPQKQINWATF